MAADEEGREEGAVQKTLGEMLPQTDGDKAKKAEQDRKTAEMMKDADIAGLTSLPDEELEKLASQAEGQAEAGPKEGGEGKEGKESKEIAIDPSKPPDFVWDLNENVYHFPDQRVLLIWGQKMAPYIQRLKADGQEVTEEWLIPLIETGFASAAKQLAMKERGDRQERQEEEKEKKEAPEMEKKGEAPQAPAKPEPQKQQLPKVQAERRSSLAVAAEAGAIEVTPLAKMLAEKGLEFDQERDFYTVPVRRQNAQGEWRWVDVRIPYARTWQKFRRAYGIAIETIDEKIEFDDKKVPAYIRVRLRATGPEGVSVEGEADFSWAIEAQRLIAEKAQNAMKAAEKNSVSYWQPQDFTFDAERGMLVVANAEKMTRAVLDLARLRSNALKTTHTKAESRAIAKLIGISSMDEKEMEDFAAEYEAALAEEQGTQ